MDFALDHIHIFARAPRAMALWMRDMLGGEMLEYRQSDGRTRIDIRFGATTLYLSTPPAEAEAASGLRRQGMDHIGFAVADVDAAVAELKGRGVAVVEPPTTTRPGVRNAFLHGPEGLLIEIMRRDRIDYGPAA